MINLKMQLKEFFLTRLCVVWHSPPKPMQVVSEFGFGYDVARHKTEPRHFRLTFTMHAAPKEKTPLAGYEIDCQIVGLFTFVEGVDEAEMQQLIRINGCTILYGILRGQIAGVTGSFVDGKFNLPTVMMHEVVQNIEADKAAARAKKNSATTATQHSKA